MREGYRRERMYEGGSSRQRADLINVNVWTKEVAAPDNEHTCTVRVQV